MTDLQRLIDEASDWWADNPAQAKRQFPELAAAIEASRVLVGYDQIGRAHV